VAGIDDALEKIDGTGAVSGYGAGRIVSLVRGYRDRGGAQALVGEGLADDLVVVGIGGEDRQLHAVVAGVLQGGEEMKLVFLKGWGPEEQIKTDVHGGCVTTESRSGGLHIFLGNVILLPFL
jgi:hypothetical protein